MSLVEWTGFERRKFNYEGRIYNPCMLFEGFSLSRIDLGEVTLRVRHGGSGPPLLLLHGHPQTHMMWHALAPWFARDFTVIAPDLRGYGESSKPESTPDHLPYSKRVMAQDQIALMSHFGYEEFLVAGNIILPQQTREIPFRGARRLSARLPQP